MTIRLDVNRQMLKWARENAGYTFEDLPKYLKDAEKWELGEKKPTWNDLRKLSKKYKRPSFFFFLQEPPEEKIDYIEFRSDNKIIEFSSDLKLEIRKTKFKRTALIKVYNQMGVNPPNFKNFVSDEKDADNLAKHIRNYLNIPIEQQQKWIFNENGNKDYTHNGFLTHWKEVCFNLGILVFETSNIAEEELSGFSLYEDYFPIIILNGKNSHNRRIFTLMHELAHLTQGKTAICDVDKHNTKETFCNKVAAEILVPQKTLSDSFIFNNKNEIKTSELSHRYGVSKQTIIYKLYSSNHINNKMKERWISKLEYDSQKDKEKTKTQKKNTTPHISTIIRKRKLEGIPYTKFILEAYTNELISSTEAMRYLDVNWENLKKVEFEIMG